MGALGAVRAMWVQRRVWAQRAVGVVGAEWVRWGVRCARHGLLARRAEWVVGRLGGLEEDLARVRGQGQGQWEGSGRVRVRVRG